MPYAKLVSDHRLTLSFLFWPFVNNNSNVHFFLLLFRASAELDDTNMEVEQTFHCKKVKRAQESKGLSISVATAPSQSTIVVSPKPKSTTQMSPSSVLMRPPTYHNHMQSRATDLSVNSSDTGDIDSNAGSSNNISNDHSANGSNKRGTTGTPARTKKLRFLKHASVAGMNETKVDDITTDIIIPRERVISICNLDKDALDDYLNEGDNSQEQEAELLQYFQPNETEKPTNAEATTVTSSTTTTTTTTTSAPVSSATLSTTTSVVASSEQSILSPSGPYPLLENYQLYQQTGQVVQTHLPDGISAMQPRQRKQDQISELRQYLQQNLHQPHASDTLTGVSDVPAFSNEVHPIPTSSASSNLMPNVIRSPPQQTIGHIGSISVTSTSNSTSKRKLNENVQQVPQPQQPTPPQLLRSVSASATVGIAQLQSPNSRRKNFSFVPISPGPQSPRPFVHHTTSNVISSGSNLIIASHTSNAPVTSNTQPHSPFVSPRVTPAIRKPINKDLMSCLTSLQSDPMIGSYKTAFSKPNSVRSDISASAPVSPSITPHHFNFQTSIMYGTGISTSNQSQQQTNSHQHQATCAVSGMCPILESRSQSVPLHCQSPAFNNNTDTNTAYSSTCNSIAQTPVPSEFADFSDENILNILAESSAEQNIKLEVNDIPDLIEADLGASMLNVRNHLNLSRSVPSTPLPIRHYGSHTLSTLNTSNVGHLTLVGTVGNSKADYDISKSVPTTPGRNCTPFRYSPEHHRDFLINGNTIETINKGNHFFPTSQPQAQPSSSQQLQQQNSHTTVSSSSSLPPNEMDDLSNYSDVNDPIIDGSDLLHNL